MDQLPTDIRILIQRLRYQIDNFIDEVPVVKTAQTAKKSKEVVIISHSLEQARKEAIKWLQSKGAVFGPHIQPIPGKLYQKRTGKQIGVGLAPTQGPKWELRIDFDPTKGPHFNAKFPGATGKAEERMAFTFPTPHGVDPEKWMSKLMESLGDTAKRPIPPK